MLPHNYEQNKKGHIRCVFIQLLIPKQVCAIKTSAFRQCLTALSVLVASYNLELDFSANYKL